MPAQDPREVGLDLWTLLAIAYAGGDGRGVSLNSIRYVAGIIRQATLTDEHLGEDLRRLQVAGLVEERDGRYRPSEPFLAFFHVREDRRSVRHDYEDLIRFLESHDLCDGGSEDPNR